MKKYLSYVIMFTMILGLFALPSVGVFAEESKHLRIASSGTATGIFNPLLVNDDYNMYMNNLIFDSLTKLSPDGAVEPNLATDWEISEDMKSYTLHLAEDAKWHDGEDLTAEDVKFTYEFLASKDYMGTIASHASSILGFEAMKSGEADSLEGIEIIDDKTIKFTTTEIYAPFLSKACYWVKIIPEHIWGEVPLAEADEQTDLIQNPVGSGPFKLAEFVPDQYSTLEKNEDYWGGVPKIDQVSYIIVNAETSLAQLLNNELDILQYHTQDTATHESILEQGVVVEKLVYNAYQDMMPNQDKEIFQNKYVRQAMATAINRQGIVDALMFGAGNVANQAYPKTFWAYPGDDKLKSYDYDPEEAIRLLTEEAGWEYTDGVMYADGEPVQLVLSYPAGNKVREQSAPVIQENFKDIGIQLDLEMVEFATLIQILEDSDKDAFDLALMGHGIGEDPDIANIFASTSGSNFMRWEDEHSDDLLKKGAALLDTEARFEVYEELAIYINEEMPTIFLYNFETPIYMWPYVEGYVPHPFDSSYNCLNWDIVGK